MKVVENRKQSTASTFTGQLNETSSGLEIWLATKLSTTFTYFIPDEITPNIKWLTSSEQGKRMYKNRKT